MLEFEVIENLKPNNDLIGILKDFKYKIKLGQIKIIFHTNLKVITPTEYQITYSTNPLEWTKLMNNYKNMAEEIVLNEYVFV